MRMKEEEKRSLERYEKLKLRSALGFPHLYPFACREIAYILTEVYSKLSKNLQAVILDDAVAAFRLLPQMQMKNAVSAATSLNRSAEAALPKQKRALAAKEFKQGKVANKRRSKVSNFNSGSFELPRDVLIQVFGLLDMKSLVSAGSVCRLWNEVAGENLLWQSHYRFYFGEFKSSVENEGRFDGTVDSCGEQEPVKDVYAAESCLHWKEAFRIAYIENPSRRIKFGRGYCGRCNCVIWLHDLRCSHGRLVQGSQNQMIEPILSLSQIVDYVLDGSRANSSYDTDSDEEVYGLWANPYTDNLGCFGEYT
ncbi:F-box protein-like protein [Drosera capensis]